MVLYGTDFEREELRWLLTSGVLGRSRNLAHMLAFLCEKHFEGKPEQITEPAVAIEALGRRGDFDPQTDTIVRVTAHLLRKRLQEIYRVKGASRRVHILIPHGQYAPSFVHQEEPVAEVQPTLDLPIDTSESKADGADRPQPARNRWLVFWIPLCVGALVCVALLLVGKTWRKQVAVPTVHAAFPKVVDTRKALRILTGSGRKPYIDHSGNLWSPGSDCKGGSSASEPDQKIAGTEDPQIFLGGIRGIAHCIFPVPSGIYEVHLLFAEASDLPEATSRAVFFLNGSDSNTLDVVDDAGGDRIATTKVFRAVRPQNDGAIHIDLISEVSLLKAVEIVPAPSEALLPIRIVAGDKAYTDPDGNVWLSDRYFLGGRFGENPGKAGDSGVYAFRRVGHFRYVLPVIPFEKYRVRLYFQEPWFGKQNGGTGGAHSRVFDLSCNGVPLLTNFDILSEAGSLPTIKTFDNIQATAQGKIELSFTPVVNYALINAIEVLPEPAP
jgi:hypothetical protein